ncbi:ABC-three component system middle component 1 [Adhaeribacter rhizoryzae]|uniref:Uncharacterized protein n=1 Tax=Adhaeribacter rhizoryzae TaxID=2607907 RepID=A0A5M6DA41_9BACT|nr:ABC-three component system middle component 1 [Adhaeribacter rhizoryzae]KAA5542065.1 hypothetical protein F0145_19965 [Adhaeribacter rhizoryzae]
MEIEVLNGTPKLKELQRKFSAFKINYFRILKVGYYNVFCISSDNNKFLERNWVALKNLIAGDFQVDFDNDFEKWNLYLIFFVKGKCEKGLKYKIENDKFSSRKIIIDNYEGSEEGYIDVVNQKLFYKSDFISIKTKKTSNPKEIVLKKLSDNIKKIAFDAGYQLKPGSGEAKELRRKAYKELLNLYSYEV